MSAEDLPIVLVIGGAWLVIVVLLVVNELVGGRLLRDRPSADEDAEALARELFDLDRHEWLGDGDR